MNFTPKRPVLIHNIHSGPLYRSFLHRQIKRRFGEIYPEGLYIPTDSSDGIPDALTQIRLFQPDSVLIAGGDGTMNALLQNEFPEELPLGIIPLGTANILAYCLYGTRWPVHTLIPNDLVPKALRLGRWKDRRFLLMAGVGFDGIAERRVSAAWKRVLGSVAYFEAGFRTVLEWRMKTIYWIDRGDGKDRKRGPSLWLIASRFPHYFPPLLLSEDRTLLENRLSLTVFSGETRSEFLLFLLHRLLKPFSDPWFGYRKHVESIRLAVEVQGQTDGEPCEGGGSIAVSDRSVTLLFSRSLLETIERGNKTLVPPKTHRNQDRQEFPWSMRSGR